VRVSWFEGSGADFSTKSREMTAKSGGGSIHQVGSTVVHLAGDRAVADTGCVILVRSIIDGAECDVATYCRHRSRVERTQTGWRLRTLHANYQKDTLAPAVPGVLPALDRDLLGSFRPSYRFLSYYNTRLGYTPNQDLPGVDRPYALAAAIEDDVRWLAGA
jgi:hypothetical protein